MGKQSIKSINLINPDVKSNCKWSTWQLEIKMPDENFRIDVVKATDLRIYLKLK
jgi:hypothetical protein